jgi:dihydroflavonol-4-reductase
MMQKTAFITGGTGFLGTNLLYQLEERGWKSYVLVRPSSNTSYLPESVETVVGSLNDLESLKKAMPKHVDAVFHVAGNTSLWRKQDAQQYQDNVVGTEHMIEAALANDAGRFICTSSIAAFGYHEEDVVIREDTPSTAANDWISYRKTKYLAESKVLEAVEKQDLDAVILNPCHIIGPYDKTSWAQLIKQVYQNKLPGIPPGVGHFCHAVDVADAHIAAYEKGRKGEKYILGGHEASFVEFINVLQKLLGRSKTYKKASPQFMMQLGLMLSNLKAVFSKGEPDLTPEKIHLVSKKIRCDYSKAANELDYQVRSMEEMIQDSLSWLQQENLL